MKSIHGMEALLDSKQLRAYLSLARCGSFTGAARELGLSQSAISHAMKALEIDIGCRLLDKVGKKVFPHAGRVNNCFFTRKKSSAR